MHPTRRTRESGLAAFGISQPDVELAKGDLVARIHRLIESRGCSPEEMATLLSVAPSELSTLFQGRLATCSLDQLLRMLTFLGDDVEITIRPRLQRAKCGVLRVLQAAAVERPEDFDPVRPGRGQRLSRPDVPDENGKSRVESTSSDAIDDRQLLNKHAVEKMTSLDITTIYRRMAAGNFPQPLRIGRRRVAWRTSDIVQWQRALEIGTETARWKASETPPPSGARSRRRR